MRGIEMSYVELEDDVTKICERFDKAKEFRSDYDDKWSRFNDLYRCVPTTTRDEAKSNLFEPEIYTLVETLITRLAANYININKPYVSVLPREPEDVRQSQIMEKLLQYYFERMNIPWHIVIMFLQALKYGTGVGKIYWNYDEAKGIDEPVFECIPLNDLYIDPDAYDIDHARWIIHRKFVSKAYLESKKSVYKNIDKLGELDDEDVYESKNEDDKNIFETDHPTGIELWEYWEDERVVTIADRRWILRDTPNPFFHKRKPFVRVVYSPDEFKFYGIGVIEPNEALQLELNTKINQRIDNVNLVLNVMFQMERGAVDDLRQLQSRPGGFIVVNEMGKLAPIEIPDVTQSAYQEIMRLKASIQETSGVTEYIRGTPGTKRETATEVETKTTQGNTRFDFHFKLMAEMGIKKIAEFTIQLLQQFMTETRCIRIVGERGYNFVTVSPDDIAGNFDLQVAIDPIQINKREKKEAIIELKQVLAQDPTVNQMALTRKVIEAYEFNPDEFIQQQPPPEMMGQMPPQMPPQPQGMGGMPNG